MTIATQIVVKSSYSTLSRFKELVRNISFLESLEDGAEFGVNVEYATPLPLLPLVPIINRKKLKCTDGLSSYLKTISFPEGKEGIENICKGTYIPVYHLSLENLCTPDEQSKKLDLLHEGYLTLLRNNIIEDDKFAKFVTKSSFGVLLGELIANIDEHSLSNNVYIYSQYWKQNDTCEICLMDDGQGLLGSLQAAGRDVVNSEDAIQKIIEQGLSAKDEFGDSKRGTGLRMTRTAITSKVVKGEFLIASGNAAYLETQTSSGIPIDLSMASIHGTVIMLKFQRPRATINIYDYV